MFRLEQPATTLVEAGRSPPPRPQTRPQTQPQTQRAQLFDALKRGEFSSSSSRSSSQPSNDDGPAVVTERGVPRPDLGADAAALLYVLTHRRSAARATSTTGSSHDALVPPSQADEASRNNPGTFDLALHLLQGMRDRRPGQDEMRALVDTVRAALAAQATERELAGGGVTQACAATPSPIRGFCC